MNKLKRVSALVFAGMSLSLASGSVHALGFGRPFSRAILGDTLTVTVPLRLETGEEISDECLAADVFFGDEKVAPSAVTARMQSGDGAERVLKVTTTALVNEPVVTVYLAAGCQARMTRKFVAFADPPGLVMPGAGEGAVSPTLAQAEDIVERAEPASRKKPSSSERRRKPGTGAPVGMAASTSDPHGATHMARAEPDAPVMSGRAARVQAEPEGDVRPSARTQLRAEQTLGAAKAEAGGRLVLDGVEADPLTLPDLRMSASMGIMLQADDVSPEVLARRRAAAALWTALNATPEQMARDRQRVQDLEKRLAQLTQENQTQKQALADAQGLGGSGKWLAMLAALSVAALTAAVYFGRQLKSRGSSRAAWWQGDGEARAREPSAQPEPVAPRDLSNTAAFVRPASAVDHPVDRPAVTPVSAEVKSPATVSTAQDVRQALHEAVPDVPHAPIQVTSAPEALMSQPTEPLREVSVEELIDLEQQAEFFVVLGQDEAAISLLEGHVASTTGASPLPYLKLLEIYRRLGRRDDYDRVQVQFNLRFNAHAPAWDDDMQHGHQLEDYPGIVERLQALWGNPAKAMEVLGRSLTRPESSEDTFDVPAYRELLFLYAVARDLSEREPHERGDVDLLLPSLDGAAAAHDDAIVADAEEEGAAFVDSGEPLMATRPNKVQPEAMPKMDLDFHLDDLNEPAESATRH